MTKQQYEMLKELLVSASEDRNDPLSHANIEPSGLFPDQDKEDPFIWVSLHPDDLSEKYYRYTYAAQCFTRVLQELQKVKAAFPNDPEMGVDLGIGGTEGPIDPEKYEKQMAEPIQNWKEIDKNWVEYNTFEIIIA